MAGRTSNGSPTQGLRESGGLTLARRMQLPLCMTKRILVGAAVVLAVALMWIVSAYVRDMGAARRRVALAGSEVVQTKCGPIEYALRGRGPPILVVHGAGGGFDQGLMLAEPLVRHGFQAIAMSRFGYLRTPLPAEATAETQADAHACLLDALGLDRAGIFGVSAGGPSTIQFCLRHPDRCSAMALMVPLAYPAAAPTRMSPTAMRMLNRLTQSDFLFWAGTKIARTAMIENVLGTPIEDFRAAPKAQQAELLAMLDSILPISPRAKGLAHEGAIAEALQPLPLEGILAPALIASVENDLYKTWEGARYTAMGIPRARFVSWPRGGHLALGHQEEWASEMVSFFGSASAAVEY